MIFRRRFFCGVCRVNGGRGGENLRELFRHEGEKRRWICDDCNFERMAGSNKIIIVCQICGAYDAGHIHNGVCFNCRDSIVSDQDFEDYRAKILRSINTNGLSIPAHMDHA